ncbi:MAG: carbon-nitrogen hydrolase family protein [Candidatus Latescibacteria bacterium]|jgi:predicted amidohydrolase|nr:carbon-nitrogen hydrolase family protein [Candidatus Latescibacterota bacterium]MBT4138328.1 carbon-nitrogen hydrolase family protein [Candidatus Latescibacterota bacterium]MBT5832364.1 carbon-nitrogen hydrolase family protein [Candidatus Latescibacterota bacterium]
MIKVATAQSHIDKDVKANGTEICTLMEQATKEGADLIHFPEGALSGYSKKEVKDWQAFDWPNIKMQLNQIADLASKLGIWVVLGCSHQLSPPNRPHNSLYIISNTGHVHTRYDKQLCSFNETMNWYTPGRSTCIFEVAGIRFGCALCIEIQFPELFLDYLDQDVHCILFSAYDDSTIFSIQAQGYAASCSSWISHSIPTAMSHTTSSKMIGPTGKVLSTCKNNTSGIIINTIDLDAPEWDIPITKARPWRNKAREGSVYRTRYVSDARSDNKQIF